LGPSAQSALTVSARFSNFLFYIRESYSWLLKRILVEQIPELSTLSPAVPSVMEHQYREIVDRPSQVHPMFVSTIHKTFKFFIITL